MIVCNAKLRDMRHNDSHTASNPKLEAPTASVQDQLPRKRYRYYKDLLVLLSFHSYFNSFELLFLGDREFER